MSTTDDDSIDMIVLPPLELQWSPWAAWDDVLRDVRTGGVTPPNDSGVYEAKYADADERLTIGKAAGLRMRVKQGLVKGKAPHSAGDAIRAKEETSRVVVRWAVTDRPAAVEEELHRRYKARFGRLPRYTYFT